MLSASAPTTVGTDSIGAPMTLPPGAVFRVVYKSVENVDNSGVLAVSPVGELGLIRVPRF
jgi:hypothetical protein